MTEKLYRPVGVKRLLTPEESASLLAVIRWLKRYRNVETQYRAAFYSSWVNKINGTSMDT